MRELTRWVIDSSCMQSQELVDFLSKSPGHIAVITDYACMEIYKARLDTAVHHGISVLARFPRQVLILKGTKAVCGLRGRQAGLTRRLIDNDQTNQFQTFCDAVSKFANGDERYREDLSRKQRLAQDHLSKMAADMSDMAFDYAKFESMFTEAEIRNIRLDNPIDSSAWEKFFWLVAQYAGSLYESHPCTKKWPSTEEWPNTFIYRAALLQFLHFFAWIRKGSPSQLSAEKIRNDVVDINFGTYATYFDGLLTNDQRSLDIYLEARHLLTGFVLPMFHKLAST